VGVLPKSNMVVVGASRRSAPCERSVLEAVPAMLAWNELDPTLLQAFGIASGLRTCRRLAWLTDVTLAIEKQGGFPGGCGKESLTRFTRLITPPEVDRDEWDSLGRPKEPVPSCSADHIRRDRPHWSPIAPTYAACRWSSWRRGVRNSTSLLLGAGWAFESSSPIAILRAQTSRGRSRP
jgi:hypothetical protein